MGNWRGRVRGGKEHRYEWTTRSVAAEKVGTVKVEVSEQVPGLERVERMTSSGERRRSYRVIGTGTEYATLQAAWDERPAAKVAALGAFLQKHLPSVEHDLETIHVRVKVITHGPTFFAIQVGGNLELPYFDGFECDPSGALELGRWGIIAGPDGLPILIAVDDAVRSLTGGGGADAYCIVRMEKEESTKGAWA